MQPILNYPNYSTTKDGRVRNNRTGKWLRGATSYGRKFYTLYVKGQPKACKAGRLVLETFVGPCPPGMQCHHRDGNRLNDHLENLKWATPFEDYLDTVKRRGRGQKLNTIQVRVIHHLLECLGFTYKEIGRIFNVSHVTISDIACGRSWSSVTGRFKV